MSTTVKPMLMTAPPHGASSYRDGAVKTATANDKAQVNVINLSGGKIRRNRHGGALQTVISPKLVSVPSPVAGNQTAQNVSNRTVEGLVSNQQKSGFDNCIGQGPSCTAEVQASQAQAGGKRRSKKWGRISRGKSGGKSHSVNWGCMSGGKKRRTKKVKKSRKHRKSRKYRK